MSKKAPRNALPGIEGIPTDRLWRWWLTGSISIRNALPGIEGIPTLMKALEA